MSANCQENRCPGFVGGGLVDAEGVELRNDGVLRAIFAPALFSCSPQVFVRLSAAPSRRSSSPPRRSQRDNVVASPVDDAR
jgi:hypothetical protein